MQHVIASVAKQSHNFGISQLEIASSLPSPATAPASPEAPAFVLYLLHGPRPAPRPVPGLTFSMQSSVTAPALLYLLHPCSRRNDDLIRSSLNVSIIIDTESSGPAYTTDRLYVHALSLVDGSFNTFSTCGSFRGQHVSDTAA
jgi:hypothetical protein